MAKMDFKLFEKKDSAADKKAGVKQDKAEKAKDKAEFKAGKGPARLAEVKAKAKRK